MTDEQLRVPAATVGVEAIAGVRRGDLLAALCDNDEILTRSEERLVAGTDVSQAGRAQLRGYVVTEEVQSTVQICLEEPSSR